MSDLFSTLPDKIFRPLAAANRHFHAALLFHLYDHTFGAVGDTPRKADVIGEIGDFIESYVARNGQVSMEDAEIAAERRRALLREAQGQDPRRHEAFAYLVETGWLIEMRDRFRKLVDLSPEGRLLLREFQRIASGDTRSYGGAVLNVLGALDTAIAHPDERSEAIHNAWQFSRDFSQHLRTVAARMRRVEEHVLKQEGLRDVFRAFFDDFVSAYLIADYKTLYTRNNPFRFRHQILERVRAVAADAPLMARLSAATVREGRAKDEAAATAEIAGQLEDVFRVFDGIDRQLDVIAETQSRVEKRIHTIVRYMDRHDGGLIDRVTRAIRALGAADLAMEDPVEPDPYLVHLDPLLGGDTLNTRKARRKDIARTRVQDVRPDPALVAFHEAKLAYARRVTVTPQRVVAFVEDLLADRAAIRGSDIAVETIDDFIVFQRLRELPHLFDGLLARRYRVETLSAQAENDWIRFADFEISRIPGKDA
jgi:hypothetical protein